MSEPIFFPDKPEFIEMEGHQVRLVRTRGEGIPILLTAPWPQSIYAFHGIWNTLRGLGPLIAVDLPGFGRSDYRPEIMAPAAMGEFIVRLAEKLGLERVHAVGPDVGTSALLLAASDTPELFESLVVGSGGTKMELLGKGLRGVIEAAPGAYGDAEGGAQVVGTITRMTTALPPVEAMEDFRLSSLGNRWVQAADYVRSYPVDLPRLHERLASIANPVLVISGRDDPIVPPANGEFLAENLPRSRHEILETGHFVWEDAPSRYADLLRNWISGEYRNVG